MTFTILSVALNVNHATVDVSAKEWELDLLDEQAYTPNMSSTFWDERYSGDDLAYGEAPNTFLSSMAGRLPNTGYALDLGAGEGRNALFLASHGLDVLAIDQSEVGMQKAQRLAQIRGLSLRTQSVDLRVKQFGHEVCTAGDGQQGIRMAAEFLPHVILMDLGMATRRPGRSANNPGQGMLLVALSGWGQDEDKRRSREAGFDHHLVKPAATSTLQQLIQESKRSTGGKNERTQSHSMSPAK